MRRRWLDSHSSRVQRHLWPETIVGASATASRGPMARTVRNAALMAHPDESDRTLLPAESDYLDTLEEDVTGLRLAWSPDLGYSEVAPEIRRITEKAAQRFDDLGCHVEYAHPGTSDPWETVDTIWSTGFAALFLDNLDEVSAQLDPSVLAVIERGRRITGPQLAKAYIRRTEYYHIWRDFMNRYDLVLTPTLPVTAFAAGDNHPATINGQTMSYLSWTAFTYPFNFTGQPAATVPCGFSSDGLFVGLQIVGRWREELTVLRASAAFEALAPWAVKRPQLPFAAHPKVEPFKHSRS